MKIRAFDQSSLVFKDSYLGISKVKNMIGTDPYIFFKTDLFKYKTYINKKMEKTLIYLKIV